MLSVKETVLDPDFDNKYIVYCTIHDKIYKHFKLAAAFARLEYVESEFAISMSQGKQIHDAVTILLPKNKDQTQEIEQYNKYFDLLMDKYRECLIQNGVPVKDYHLIYYGVIDDKYPDYKGKVNEKPFFDFLHQLEHEVLEEERV